MSNLDLKTFEYPEPNAFDMPTDKALLAEAHERGFYNGNTAYNQLFCELFFSGGRLSFKADLAPDVKARVLPYLKAFMGSFSASHEDKEAICAMLLSELVEPDQKSSN